MVSKTEFITVGREGDETLIDGVSLWAHKWEIASNSAFLTKHPSYPNRPYAVHFYRIVVDRKTIGFGAGKIEEGVWAFYRIIGQRPRLGHCSFNSRFIRSFARRPHLSHGIHTTIDINDVQGLGSASRARGAPPRAPD